MVAPPPLPDPDDDREFVLSKLAGPPFNNQAVANMLNDLRAARSQPAPTPQMSGDIASVGGPSLEDLDAPTDEPTEVVDLSASPEPAVEEAEPPVEDLAGSPEVAL